MASTVSRIPFKARRVSESLRRPGMTLIEVLVVITIMTALAGIVALVAPKFGERSRVADASRQLTAWLGMAQQRAIRDKGPRGIRFVDKLPQSVAQSEDFYYKFAYVEQPNDITGVPAEIFRQNVLNSQVRNSFQTSATTQLRAAAAALNPLADAALINKYTYYANQIDPNNNPNGWMYLLWLQGRNLQNVVLENDVVEFGGARYTLVYKPLQDPASPVGSFFILHRPRDEVKLTPDVNTFRQMPTYRVTRAAQPIAGEPELTLPQNVAVDIVWTNIRNNMTATRTTPAPDQNNNSNPTSLNIDVLFGPSGEIIGDLGNSGRIIFWLRDISLADPGAGQMPDGDNRLVVLHCRTGQITNHAVAADINMVSGRPILTDPYRYVRDGKSSAMED